MNRIQTVAPYADPINISEAIDHLRLSDSPADRALVLAMISAATQYVESLINRQLVTATWVRYFNYMPSKMYLGPGPLQSISSITYTDTAGNSQTLSSTYYDTSTTDVNGLIIPAYGYSWPTAREKLNSVAVTYKTGYQTPVTVAASTDVWTAKGRTYANNDVVRLSNSGGSLPNGLDSWTDYYVVNVSGSTFQLSTSSGGSAINLTDAGTGTHFVGSIPMQARIGILMVLTQLYEERSPIVTGTISTKIHGLDAMLWNIRAEEPALTSC